MSRGRSARIAGACALLTWLAVGSARAEASTEPRRHSHVPLPGSDGVYARFDGDLAFSLAVGAEFETGEPRASLRAAGHYLWTAGAYLRYADALGGAGPRAQRVLSFGVDLRPLFLPRFALDNEQGPAFLDLSLDSFALTGGAYLAQPQGGEFIDERGFEAGLGLGLPLLGTTEGPWLEARAERRFPDTASASWLVSVLVSWHTLTLSARP